MSSSSAIISHGDEEEEEEVPEEIEVEIEEVISGSVTSAPLESTRSKAPVADQQAASSKQQKQRSLFNLDDAMNPANYDSDDVLAGGNLAVHFHAESEPSDSLDQLLNDLRVEDAVEDRDDSPQSEVILLNDQIVSIHSLKERQDHHNTEPGTATNCSTTNDISEIIPDDASKSLPKYSEDTEHEQDEVEEEAATPTVVPSASFEEERSTTKESPVVVEEELLRTTTTTTSEVSASVITLVKPMERCLDFGKEVLEDISEESEQALESLKVDEMRVYSVTKPNPPVLLKTFSDASFFDPKVLMNSASGAATAAQETFNSLDGNKFNVDDAALLKEAQSKDSLSIVTNTSATEYRALQDEYLARVYNIKGEIAERDDLIEKLTESLQESLNERDHLQEKGLEMAEELQQLQSQLSEAVENLRQQNQKQNWRTDDMASQMLSEVSMDLVSDDDDEYEREGRKKDSKHLKSGVIVAELPKQVEEFQKYLNAEELRIFQMVQKKFDAYHEEELEKARLRHAGELKLLRDSLETEKQTLERELAQSRDVAAIDAVVAGVREELHSKHAQEMAGLREYFEKKCTELEKQYSEEVFSQSQKHSSLDSESELSGDELPIGGMVMSPRSPKKASNLGVALSKDLVIKGTADIEDSKLAYEERIRRYEDQLKVLRNKLQHYERRNADDELMVSEEIYFRFTEIIAVALARNICFLFLYFCMSHKN